MTPFTAGLILGLLLGIVAGLCFVAWLHSQP